MTSRSAALRSPWCRHLTQPTGDPGIVAGYAYATRCEPIRSTLALHGHSERRTAPVATTESHPQTGIPDTDANATATTRSDQRADDRTRELARGARAPASGLTSLKRQQEADYEQEYLHWSATDMHGRHRHRDEANST